MDDIIKQGVLIKDSESRVINGPNALPTMHPDRHPAVVGSAVFGGQAPAQPLPGVTPISDPLADYRQAVDSARREPRVSDELQRLVDAAKGRAAPKPSAEDVARKDPLLAERGKTHGNWAVNAGVSQAIKEVMRKECGTLPAPLQEALDVICTKLGRIAAGDALFYDHWKDIAGYAKLAEAYCDELRPRDQA